MTARLNVNIDHVATVRQARRAPEPSVVAAALMCEEAGADGVTVHLRGDRRHIQDEDIYTLRRVVSTYLNVEMAATDEMVRIATDARPDAVSLVAETPGEITTEGGLDAAANFDAVRGAVDRLREGGLFVSLFIDPDPGQIEAAHRAGLKMLEYPVRWDDVAGGSVGFRSGLQGFAELRQVRRNSARGLYRDAIARARGAAERVKNRRRLNADAEVETDVSPELAGQRI